MSALFSRSINDDDVVWRCPFSDNKPNLKSFSLSADAQSTTTLLITFRQPHEHLKSGSDKKWSWTLRNIFPQFVNISA